MIKNISEYCTEHLLMERYQRILYSTILEDIVRSPNKGIAIKGDKVGVPQRRSLIGLHRGFHRNVTTDAAFLKGKTQKQTTMSKLQKKTRFATSTADKQEKIIQERSRPNTQRATKLWINCFTDYLQEKELPTIDELTIQNLPGILEQFYSEVRKKEVRDDPEGAAENSEELGKLYKNTTLKAIRSALTRYFKDKLCIDIISNEAFIRANSIFAGIQKINKALGKGNVVSKPPLEDIDLKKITDYFKEGMSGPPNAALLQEIVLFNTVLYMCRRGRENLRAMSKETFKIAVDPEDNRRYIYQAIDEADKNHSSECTGNSNDGRIYEVPGK